mmetsp:Transcript_92829/g.203240  ORF Transcript_92829/g.203240 Transcript_92829/m.203240 type:complete len:129 (+) Transcript_92829:160-546(+)
MSLAAWPFCHEFEAMLAGHAAMQPASTFAPASLLTSKGSRLIILTLQYSHSPPMRLRYHALHTPALPPSSSFPHSSAVIGSPQQVEDSSLRGITTSASSSALVMRIFVAWQARAVDPARPSKTDSPTP